MLKEVKLILIPYDVPELKKGMLLRNEGFGLEFATINNKEDEEDVDYNDLLKWETVNPCLICDDPIKYKDYILINDIIRQCVGFNDLGDIECDNNLCYVYSACKKVMAHPEHLQLSTEKIHEIILNDGICFIEMTKPEMPKITDDMHYDSVMFDCWLDEKDQYFPKLTDGKVIIYLNKN